MGGKKRDPYAFGLGKRASDMYSFGLGKKEDPYAFGLGKRAERYAFGLGKRDPYAFGLGKRDPYAFGLGRKRDPYSFGLGRKTTYKGGNHSKLIIVSDTIFCAFTLHHPEKYLKTALSQFDMFQMKNNHHPVLLLK